MSLMSLIITRVAVGLLLITQVETDPLAGFREAAKSWEPDIQRLEKQDETEVADDQTILYVGSSSIRLWETIQQDLPRRKSLRRAYGGAHFSDLAIFMDRLIARHHPQAVVVFVANDISGDPQRDIPPKKVVELAKYTLQRIRKKLSEVPVFFVAITPTPSRFAVWDQISLVNQGISQFSQSDPNCHFIETASHFLNEQGKPRADLFVADQLHLNHDGYLLWAELFEKAFQEVLPAALIQR